MPEVMTYDELKAQRQSRQGNTEVKAEVPEMEPEAEPAPAEQAEDSAPEERTEDEILSSEDTEPETAPEADKPDKRSRAAERRIAQLIREKEQLKGQLALSQPKAPAAITVQDDPQGPPDPQQYQDVVSFKVAEALYLRDQQAKHADFQARSKRLLQEHPDLPDLIAQDAQRVQQGVSTSNPTVAQIVRDSDVGPQVWYHLLSNPEEAQRIARMDPVGTARALTKIELKYQNDSEDAPGPKVSKAPKPLTPVKAAPLKAQNQRKTRFELY
jgi:hypothetical protein